MLYKTYTMLYNVCYITYTNKIYGLTYNNYVVLYLTYAINIYTITGNEWLS